MGHRRNAMLLVAALMLVTPGHAAGLAKQDVARIDGCVQASLSKGDAAGYVVGVMEGQGLAFARAYGSADRAGHRPMRVDSVLRVGSITKQFTAAATLLLAEQGRIDLDAPVSRYLDIPHGDEIRVSDLLGHISGIHNYTAQPNFFDRFGLRPQSTAEMVELIVRQDPFLDFAPGTAWRYSNSNYLLLGAIIEKISGESYAAFVARTIFRPLGMDHTAVDTDGAEVPARARGYSRKDGELVEAAYLTPTVAGAAGAIRTTLPDLARWMAARDAGEILKPASYARMTAPARLRDGSIARVGQDGQYAMGLMLRDDEGRTIVGHGGTIRGFNAAANRYADGRVILLLTNTDGAADRLIGPLSDVLEAPGPSAHPRPDACPR